MSEPPAAGTVGDLLRRLREGRGLTLEAVALETRIPIISLRKIEANRFAELPGDVFVRGFLRAYARTVGAEMEQVLQAYEHRHGPPAPPKASRWPGLFRSPRRRRLGWLVVMLLFLAGLAALYWFVVRSPTDGVAAGVTDPTPADAVP